MMILSIFSVIKSNKTWYSSISASLFGFS